MPIPPAVTTAISHAEVIIDVGANVGETVLDAHAAFPNAMIYAVEPITRTYLDLVEAVGGIANVKVMRTAFSDHRGSAVMRAVPRGKYNRILKDTDRRPDEIEVVALTTGATFCADHALSHVDFLKIDTEGHDLDVLKGFEPMLNARVIRFVQVEAAISRDNAMHVRIDDYLDFFGRYGYGLVTLYEPVRRNPIKRMHQRGMFFCNCLFAAEDRTEREQRLALREARLAERRARLAER